MQLEAMVGEHTGPDGFFRIRRVRNDPEAAVGMVDDGHDLVGHRSYRPSFAEEV